MMRAFARKGQRVATRMAPLCTKSVTRTVKPTFSHLAYRPTSFQRIGGVSFSRAFSSEGDLTAVIPSLGDSISEATVVNWVKGVGEYVELDETYLVLETDKVSVDIRAQQAGVLKECKAEEDETVVVGQEIAVFDTTAAAPAGGAAAAAAAPAAAEPAAAAAPGTAAASPAPAASAPPPPPPPPPPPTAKPSAPGSRETTSVPLSRMRMTIARRMKEAQNSAAMLTTFNEVDMSAIMALRSKYKDEFLDTHGAKLGFNSIFCKAAAKALMKYPQVNAVYNEADKLTTYRDYVDINIAVSTPTGLVVPVLRNVEGMSFAGVEGAIAELGRRARGQGDKLAMEDMAGGTFTITNGGVFGSLMGTPILSAGQTAILGMHAIFKRPVVVGNEIVIRPMMMVALTYDHRLCDGSDAVTFLKDIKMSVEDPARLMLDL